MAGRRGAHTTVLHVDDYEAAVFDLDGVVTKTARVHAAAWKRLFDEFLAKRAGGKGQAFRPFDIEADYRRYVDGKPREEGVAGFLDSRGITLPQGSADDPEDRDSLYGLGNRKNALFHQALQEEGVETYRSTIDFIRAVRARGLRTAVVSSSRNCAAVLEAAGLRSFFDVKVDGADLRRHGLRGKPAPDMYLRAAALLAVPASRVMVFEDAQAGVRAGREGRFGLVVGVDRSGHPERLRAEGADLVVADLDELAVAGPPRQRLPSALEKVPDILARAEHRELAIFLDYDGTLTPIVDRPEGARLSEAMRGTLRALGDRHVVAIVSGRDRADVERLVGLPSLCYAGSHGFDIAGPQTDEIRHEAAVEYLPALDRAEAALRARLESIDGALVERKRFSIAVHYRLVPQARQQEVGRAVDAVVDDSPRLRKLGGKMIYEVQPALDWDKGRAVLWLLAALRLSSERVHPLYLGDDVTDEDAFRALAGRGTGVLVGEADRETAASYALEDPGEVRLFLERLRSALDGNDVDATRRPPEGLAPS